VDGRAINGVALNGGDDDLQVAWVFPLAGSSRLEVTPVVVGGIMYVDVRERMRGTFVAVAAGSTIIAFAIASGP
jgi:hypothetical protein